MARRGYRPLAKPKPIEEVLIEQMVACARWWRVYRTCALQTSSRLAAEHRESMRRVYDQFVQLQVVTHQIGFDRPLVEAKARARALAELGQPLPDWLGEEAEDVA